MQRLPLKLSKKLESRQVYGTYRKLKNSQELVDFSSNDYLGIGQHKIVFAAAGELLDRHSERKSGSGGSRLLSGNSVLYEKAEDIIKGFHQAEAALIFNSGYDANVGFFSSVPQRDDLVFYDEYIHASVRDGIAMGKARGFKFKHNDLADLSESINRKRAEYPAAEIYVVTESVFSMDGDSPDLKLLAEYTSEQGILLVIDEAHAVGVLGERGEGLVQQEGIEDLVFARIVTFGKAIGCHGAAILSKTDLKEYLINFSRSLIYTTALPPHTLSCIIIAYRYLKYDQISSFGNGGSSKLREIIAFFTAEIKRHQLTDKFIFSRSAVQTCIISGNEKVKEVSEELALNGFDVRPILSPTVPSGRERLRFCIHTHNTQEDISEVLKLIKNFIV